MELTSIKEDDVCSFSPLFRMVNEQHAVGLIGWENGLESWLHHTHAIVLALCNGVNTVGQIAEITKPFTHKTDPKEAYEAALSQVKAIISTFSMPKDEREGKGKIDYVPQYPLAPVVPVCDVPHFRAFRNPAYDANKLTPEHAYPPGKYPLKIKSRAPHRIIMHLTSACAVDCKYCYLKRRNIHNSELVPFTRMREIIRECQELGVANIDANGGDVLLYPHLIEFIRELDECNFLPLRLSTKARLTREMAEQLADVGNIGEMQFSLDSTVEEIEDFLINKPGGYKTIMQSIDNALAVGLPVVVKSVITPYNILTVPKLYREMKQKGVSLIRLAAYGRSGYHHTDDLFNTSEGVDWLQQELDKLREEFPDDMINLQNGGPVLGPMSQKQKEEKWPERSMCTSGRQALTVCSDGTVIPCEQMQESPDTFCGNLIKQSVKEVWESERYNQMTALPPRHFFSGWPCETCPEFDPCITERGYCFRDTYQHYGHQFMTPVECPKSDPDVRFVRTL